jgi:hypothetical protein
MGEGGPTGNSISLFFTGGFEDQWCVPEHSGALKAGHVVLKTIFEACILEPAVELL